MKSFLSFLFEAKQSKAVQQATKMGLRSDGHGGWYDERGEFVAKTKGDGLEFFNSNQNPDGRDPNQSAADKATSGEEAAGGAALGTRVKDTEGATQAQADKGAVAPEVTAQDAAAAPAQAQQAAQPAAAAPTEQQYPADVPKTKGTLTLAFGRFNPPTVGHQKLMDKVASSSDDNDYMIIPSRSEDKKKNPLGVDRKAAMMRQLYPDHAEKIVNDAANRTIFDVMRKAHNDGYANVRIVGGGDRVGQFEKLANKYNGSTYQFDNIEVINAGDRDPDSDDTDGMSASKMRKAAKDNDFVSFKKGMPKSLGNEVLLGIFTELQDAMGVTPKEAAVSENWEIAPKLHLLELREEYVNGNIFNIGDMITHDTTGMYAEIVRTGANYLICVTEDDKMFKTWTQDVSYNNPTNTPQSKVNSFTQFLSKFS
jgi:hypothetical protein